MDVGFLLHIDGTINFLGFASGTGVLDMRVSPTGFEMTFALKFVLGPLTFDASGGAARVRRPRPRLRDATADPRGGRRHWCSRSTPPAPCSSTPATRRTIGIAGNSFLLDVQGTVSILKVFNFDAGMHFEVGREKANGPQKDNAWFFNAHASVDFFGLASLSGTIFLNSDGDFDLQLAGFMQLGSSSFGLRGDFAIGITSIHDYDPVLSTEYYLFRLSGSASVRVRAFGVTLVGLGIGFSFEFDTRNIGMDGRVPIVLSVHIEVDLWLFSVSADADFTIGYLQFPKPTYMASNGVLTGGTYRVWGPSNHVLVLNVGDQPHRTARNIGTAAADIHENVLVEQVGTGPGGATIKVSAYGRSNTYEHVTSITGNFFDGSDIVTIDPSVTVPVTISGGTGNDVISLRRDRRGHPATATGAIDSISVTGNGNATVNGGTDRRLPRARRHRNRHAQRWRRQRRPHRQLADRRAQRRRWRRRAAGPGRDLQRRRGRRQPLHHPRHPPHAGHHRWRRHRRAHPDALRRWRHPRDVDHRRPDLRPGRRAAGAERHQPRHHRARAVPHRRRHRGRHQHRRAPRQCLGLRGHHRRRAPGRPTP